VLYLINIEVKGEDLGRHTEPPAIARDQWPLRSPPSNCSTLTLGPVVLLSRKHADIEPRKLFKMFGGTERTSATLG